MGIALIQKLQINVSHLNTNSGVVFNEALGISEFFDKETPLEDALQKVISRIKSTKASSRVARAHAILKARYQNDGY